MTKTRHRISWQMSLNQCADRRSKPEPIGGSVSRNQEPDKRILIRAHVYSWGGYGQMAEHLGRALERLGYPVAYDPLMVAEEFGAAQPFIVPTSPMPKGVEHSRAGRTPSPIGTSTR